MTFILRAAQDDNFTGSIFPQTSGGINLLFGGVNLLSVDDVFVFVDDVFTSVDDDVNKKDARHSEQREESAAEEIDADI